MFIGRYFVPRKIAALIGAALSVAVVVGGFFAYQATMSALSAEPAAIAAPAPTVSSPTGTDSGAPQAPTPGPTGASGAPSASPSSEPTAGATEPAVCVGPDCPAQPSNVPTQGTESVGPTPEQVTPAPTNAPKYTADTAVVSVIDVAAFEGSADEKAWSTAVAMWRQVLLLAQTNARPERILEMDLDIIGARLSGVTWDPAQNKIVFTDAGETATVFLCLPAGPALEACEVAPA